ncbi:globin domain-containing protein [Streptomyces sp. NPDC056411]|uniref:globin domain-containing protein n=1 Tax=Streptomyces sp. NPDC056411 TaxID=3345813 RepID=UPI0035D57F9D
MDAPTTTSADNGSSGGSSGDWGWFTPPAKKSSSDQQEGHHAQGRQDQDGRAEQDDPGEPHDPDAHRGPGWNEQGEWSEQGGRGQQQIPSRPVNPIRPVGNAAARGRGTEQPQAPQRHHETAPRPAAPAAPVAPAAAVPPTAPVAPVASAQPPAPAPAPGYSDPFTPYTPPRHEPEPAQEREPETARQQPVWEREYARGREPEPRHEAAHNAAAPGTLPGMAPAAPGAAPAAPAAPTAPTAPTAPAAPMAPAAPAPPPPAEAAPPAASSFAPNKRPAAPAAEPSLEALEAAASSATPASPDAVLIRRTMAEIEPVADKVTSYFYALLFVQHPDLRALFPASMDTQRDRLFKALLTAAQHVDDAEVLGAYLANLGRGHRKYGTQPDHYPAVGECLLNALARYATTAWSPETEAAWVRAYTAISQIMIDAAAADEARAPAWWQAEVVSHELRTPDIAVVTVRPDQPYPFLAGQYTSIETPWWPRVWRHYSFASAPRSDGLLSFHVKAVPAGWVSNAMVHRARPGDVIRLGAPAGSMTVDHTTRNGLLCVGGGTGIAPIKALIEDVAEHGVRRPVDVFYGARTDHDLYDLDTMLRLEQSHQWLSVRPVVASGPAIRGGTSSETGQLPDAVRQYGPFREYDAYLSGPPGLIRSGVDALVGVGIPTNRIRHDSIEELVAAGA